MRKLATALLAGTGALFVGSANAADIYTSGEYATPNLLHQARVVCDEDGRCYRTRGGRASASASATIVGKVDGPGTTKTASIRPADTYSAGFMQQCV